MQHNDTHSEQIVANSENQQIAGYGGQTSIEVYEVLPDGDKREITVNTRVEVTQISTFAPDEPCPTTTYEIKCPETGCKPAAVARSVAIQIYEKHGINLISGEWDIEVVDLDHTRIFIEVPSSELLDEVRYEECMDEKITLLKQHILPLYYDYDLEPNVFAQRISIHEIVGTGIDKMTLTEVLQELARISQYYPSIDLDEHGGSQLVLEAMTGDLDSREFDQYAYYALQTLYSALVYKILKEEMKDVDMSFEEAVDQL